MGKRPLIFALYSVSITLPKISSRKNILLSCCTQFQGSRSLLPVRLGSSVPYQMVPLWRLRIDSLSQHPFKSRSLSANQPGISLTSIVVSLAYPGAEAMSLVAKQSSYSVVIWKIVARTNATVAGSELCTAA